MTETHDGRPKLDITIPPFKQMPDRTPQFPLKTQRMLYSNEDVKRARENVRLNAEARKVQENVVQAANSWVCRSDAELRALMPDARVPRAFDCNPRGCPIHGAEIFKHGTYPWIIDPQAPLKLKCPVGGETYPSNDYAFYYQNDLKTQQDFNADYADYTDNGWGWIAPDGERYWFVAHANLWMWYKHVLPGMLSMARAYLLTGETRYAHKAAIMLHRLAEIYPSMDHENQSRYGALMRAQGDRYPGKLLYHTWETDTAQMFAEAYDLVWDSIDSDLELQQSLGKNGQQIRSFIEANLLEDAVDAYFEGKIEGNFGMHQKALLYVLLAREGMDNQKYFDLLVNDSNPTMVCMGLRYALYNLLYRDGVAFESPGYNDFWVRDFAVLSELLRKGGYDLFADPRIKALFDSQISLVVNGNFTPCWGDSMDALGGIVGRDWNTYRIGYNEFTDPRYLHWLLSDHAARSGFTTFESLFQKPLPTLEALLAGRAVTPQRSRLMAGFGMAILNNPADTTGLALTYGYHGSHYHWDFLNFELFANGQSMMPDLGYPDAMNEFVPEIFTWSTNTIAHNTVVVDGRRQHFNRPGILHNFADALFARSIDASAEAYEQASQYRRNLLMVDVDERQSFSVDFFRVTGGQQHDYSLHGPPGKVILNQEEWGAVRPGTLAGPDVTIGQIYDDPALGAQGYSGSYDSYQGSGFQHLFNVQESISPSHDKDGNAVVEYAHISDKNARLRIHLLPSQLQQIFVADAYDKPRAKDYLIKFLIARHTIDIAATELQSTFISILETFKEASFIHTTRLLKLNCGTGHAVEVKRIGATDIIISDADNSTKMLIDYPIITDAASAVVTLDESGELQRVFFSDGTFLRYENREFNSASVTGKVIEIDIHRPCVTIALDGDTSDLNPGDLSGKIAHFTNSVRTAVHPLKEAVFLNGKLELVPADSLLVGRSRVHCLEGNTVYTSINLPFASTYPGASLLTESGDFIGKVQHVQDGVFTLLAPPAAKVAAGDDIWLANTGIGDEMEIKPVFHWKRS